MKSFLIATLSFILSLPLQGQYHTKKELIRKMWEIDRQYTTLISVGASVKEVKSKMGNPMSIQPGFPDGIESLVYQIPDFHGQLNYSTWIYKNKVLSDSWKEPEGGDATIDGVAISKELWQSYKTRDSIYWESNFSPHRIKLHYESGSEPMFDVEETTYDAFDIGEYVSPKLDKNNIYVFVRPQKSDMGQSIVGIIVQKRPPTMTVGDIANPENLPQTYISKPQSRCIIKVTPIKQVTKSSTYRTLIFVIFDRGTQSVADVKVSFLSLND